MGLGGYPLVSLAEARQMAIQYRRVARDGGDPVAEKRKSQVTVPTFAEAARVVHADHAQSWKNEKHKQQWINTLTQYAFPLLGARRINDIGTPDILRVLGPIWMKRPETARRVKQRIGVVMDWARTAGYRDGDNPVAGVLDGLPNQREHKRRHHHAALSFHRLPEFIQSLRTARLSETVKLAFEFLILTAARTSEVLNARWNEVDLHNELWTIPAARMKAGVEHRVPLSQRCVEILRRARAISAGCELVFPGRFDTKPISNMSFLMALRRMGVGVTAHGFRSVFRDWAAESTHYSREVCESALAHTIKDKSEAAYRRGDLLEKRRELMAAWANFAVTPPSGAKVVQIRRR